MSQKQNGPGNAEKDEMQMGKPENPDSFHHSDFPIRHSLHLLVDVPTQMLHLIESGETKATFPISTSRFGLGTEPGSFRTPLGHFEIAEKIGANEPSGTIFQARQPVGILTELGGEEDLILTRILWLNGLDPENANTHERYLYIHGTNQESLIGTPASHGCIRMRNPDICRLFDWVVPGTPVEIRS